MRLPSDLQQYIQALPGVTHVTSFIGGGGLRFMLVYTPERENRAFAQFLVDVNDPKEIDGLVATIQKHLDGKYPGANAVAKKFGRHDWLQSEKVVRPDVLELQAHRNGISRRSGTGPASQF